MIIVISVVAFLLAVGTAIVARNKIGAEQVVGGAILVAVAALVGMVVSFFAIVPAGAVGVQDVFGKVSDTSLKSGVNIINPLARVAKISIKTQEQSESMGVPSSEGLTVKLDVTVLYKLSPEAAPEIYKTVGVNYQSVILIPRIRSVVREVISGHQAVDLYSPERVVISKEMGDNLAADLKEKGIIIERVLLRDVTLPRTLVAAIEEKQAAEQDAQRQKILIVARSQEAEGKRDAQRIITETLTPAYLQWLWIEALSRNPNVVYVATEANVPMFKSIGEQPRPKPMLPPRGEGGTDGQ